jgi:DNA-binding transcriptional regulator YdaS (Cro superfamily)
MNDTFTLSHNQLIDLLGGTKKVAKMAKVSQAAVTHWRTTDIPEGQMIRLAAELEKQSHGLITRKSLFPSSWEMIWPELKE